VKREEKHGKSVARFWERCNNAACERGVSEPFDQWYFVRARDYVRADHGPSPRQQTAENVTQYFHVIGRKNELKDWQCTQIVGAIQILFQDVVRAEWASGFDWDGWKERFRDLENDHPTEKVSLLVRRHGNRRCEPRLLRTDVTPLS
jgi:hypothetical protein